MAVRALAKRRRTSSGGVSAPLSVGDRTWLQMIAVLPGYQGKGLARRLLGLCEERTRQLGRKGIVLCAEGDSPRARAIYEKWGFLSYAESRRGTYYAKLLVP